MFSCIVLSGVLNLLSPVSREGKYIPLPQRAREMGVSGSSMRGERERGERGGGGGGTAPLPNRMGGYHSSRPGPPNSSPRPPLPASGGQPTPSSERNSPLSSRGGYSPHHPQSSPGPASAYTPTAALGNAGGGGPSRLSEPASASPAAPALAPPTSPPTAHSHSLPLPHSLSDTARPVNGGEWQCRPAGGKPSSFCDRFFSMLFSLVFSVIQNLPKIPEACTGQ